MSFRFFFKSIPPRRYRLSGIRLLPSKTNTVKKSKHREKMAENSEPAPSQKNKYCVKFNDLWCNNFKSSRNAVQVKVLLYVLCVEAISVLYMDEKMISIDTRTPQRDIWMWHKGKEN